HAELAEKRFHKYVVSCFSHGFSRTVVRLKADTTDGRTASSHALQLRGSVGPGRNVREPLCLVVGDVNATVGTGGSISGPVLHVRGAGRCGIGTRAGTRSHDDEDGYGHRVAVHA